MRNNGAYMMPPTGASQRFENETLAATCQISGPSGSPQSPLFTPPPIPSILATLPVLLPQPLLSPWLSPQRGGRLGATSSSPIHLHRAQQQEEGSDGSRPSYSFASLGRRSTGRAAPCCRAQLAASGSSAPIGSNCRSTVLRRRRRRTVESSPSLDEEGEGGAQTGQAAVALVASDPSLPKDASAFLLPMDCKLTKQPTTKTNSKYQLTKICNEVCLFRACSVVWQLKHEIDSCADKWSLGEDNMGKRRFARNKYTRSAQM
ncbi:uncharacterized protein LOC124664393 [Lolium rigidum]|uniref:uncharacterized protein LOC124664393 n=1 Tax=Lolium rigidum TaxID=89674 RepID=UPI001F5DB9F0|nr:uncharacterized protein LOC124664393 [Lolium rigidum]